MAVARAPAQVRRVCRMHVNGANISVPAAAQRRYVVTAGVAAADTRVDLSRTVKSLSQPTNMLRSTC